MKRLIISMLLLLAVLPAFSQTGSADVEPGAVSVGAYHPIIKISYKPDAAVSVNGGSVEIRIPEGFSPPPTTLNDNLTAAIMAGNVTVAVVDALNIAIDGMAVTINAVTLAAGQQLVVTYGNTGAGGIYPPANPGQYYFEVREKTSGVSSFAPLDEQPYLYITYIMIDKTSPSFMVKAGDTVTYYLDYKNFDGANQVSALTVWDTLPEGMTFLASVPPVSLATGGFLKWDAGNMLASASVKITVVAKANEGIINFGEKCVNSVSVSAIHPVKGLNIMETKKEIPVQGVKLTTSLLAYPSDVQPYQDITLVMGITNAGNMMAAMVSGTVEVISDGGSALLYTSPVPAYASGLSAGQSTYFTWIYKGTSAGSIHFSGHARAQENAFVVTSIQAGTNYVNITDPTPTFTATPVLPTETPVLPTATPVIPTATPVLPTETPVLPTETPFIPTFTPTDTPVITVVTTPATPVITPVVTQTPQTELTEKLRTDKNYINLTNGDMVEIKYLVESAGNVTIRIYNLSGEEIRGYNENSLSPGIYSVNWDGTNEAGKKVGKGLYFISVNQPGGRTIKKIIITK